VTLDPAFWGHFHSITVITPIMTAITRRTPSLRRMGTTDAVAGAVANLFGAAATGVT